MPVWNLPLSFVVGCSSEDFFATSAVTSNECVQETGCKCNLSQPGHSGTVVVDDTKNDVTSSETCINCGTESSGKELVSGTTEVTETFSNPPSVQNEDIQGFIEGLRDALSHCDQKANKSYEHQGARPKITDKSKNRQEPSNTHLSNKKRKELAKQEKKKRREERRKENTNSCGDSSVTGGQTAPSSVVPDLGLLAIWFSNVRTET